MENGTPQLTDMDLARLKVSSEWSLERITNRQERSLPCYREGCKVTIRPLTGEFFALSLPWVNTERRVVACFCSRNCFHMFRTQHFPAKTTEFFG